MSPRRCVASCIGATLTPDAVPHLVAGWGRLREETLPR